MNKKDVKFFLVSFAAFILASFVYNNFSTDTIAKGVSFKEITVKIVGDIKLDLDCKGTTAKNPASINRGQGSQIFNQCVGKGKITAEFPQQRFVEDPNIK